MIAILKLVVQALKQGLLDVALFVGVSHLLQFFLEEVDSLLFSLSALVLLLE